MALTPDDWQHSIEQIMIFLLIVGRWLTPKTRISHQELSLILFIYIGIGSDIMELFNLFDECYVFTDPTVVYIILAVWNFSLLQFVLRVAPTRGLRSPVYDEDDQEEELIYELRRKALCCSAEMWSIFMSSLLQDGPFLALRLYVMIKNKDLTPTILFFSLKNALLLIIAVYRLIVVVCCTHDALARPVVSTEQRIRNQQNQAKPPKGQKKARGREVNGRDYSRENPLDHNGNIPRPRSPQLQRHDHQNYPDPRDNYPDPQHDRHDPRHDHRDPRNDPRHDHRDPRNDPRLDHRDPRRDHHNHPDHHNLRRDHPDRHQALGAGNRGSALYLPYNNPIPASPMVPGDPYGHHHQSIHPPARY